MNAHRTQLPTRSHAASRRSANSQATHPSGSSHPESSLPRRYLVIRWRVEDEEQYEGMHGGRLLPGPMSVAFVGRAGVTPAGREQCASAILERIAPARFTAWQMAPRWTLWECEGARSLSGVSDRILEAQRDVTSSSSSLPWDPRDPDDPNASRLRPLGSSRR